MTDIDRQFDSLRHLHELILRSAGEGIYGLGADGRASFVNAAAQDMLGWTEQDLVGEFIHDFHHHSHADGSPYPRDACPIYAALTDGKIHREENEVFWHKNGRAIPVEYVSTPILNEGRIAGAVIVFTDISARKAAEAKLHDALLEVRSLKNALESERDYLRDEVLIENRFGDIVGSSPALNRTLTQVAAVAQTNASVLILGETGVGKELVAREIHRRSPRQDKPLIKVNCSSIPGELFESEFFGHARGAYTGAHRNRLGRFQLADGGTLFLDEVGEIPFRLQSKLLRVLQEQEVEPVGGQLVRKIDVRVIAATNRDLKEDVAAGRFREDLFYRLSVFPVEVPPLRDRKEDIIPLALHFIEQNAAELKKPNLRLTKKQSKMLTDYRWPGNVRELQHLVARAAILSAGTKLEIEESSSMPGSRPPVPEPHSEAFDGQSRPFMSETEMLAFQRRNMETVLTLTNWRISGTGGAAELLGVKPTTLEYRLKRLGLRKPD